MRVAYFTETLPPLTDGVTRTLGRLADTLEAEDVDFHFFSAMVPDESVRWRHRVHRVPSVPFLPYNYYRISLPILNTLDPPLDSFRPDLIHTVNPTPLGLYGIAYARRRGLPVVASYHTDFVSYFRYYGLRGLEPLGWQYLTWFYNQCDITYAPSRTAVAALEAHGVRSTGLWERGIDPQAFSVGHRSDALRRSWGAGSAPVLLFVGRLVAEKNLRTLVDACTLLDSWGERYRMVFVGDGPLRQELTDRLPKATFAGFQHGQELARWYASSDLFVFPSVTETFGNVVLEAFASGLPVIAAARGGVQDLVRPDQNGLLAEPDSPFSFASRIRELLRDPARRHRLAAGGRSTAAHYRWPEVNRRLLAGYDALLTPAPAAVESAA
jgi:glycosyltransferase involved in cell wall biosynthesis